MYKCVSSEWHRCTFIGWSHCPHRGYLRISPHTSKAHCSATCLIMMRRMTTTKIMVMMTITIIPRQIPWLQKSRKSGLGNLTKWNRKELWSATCLMSRRTTTRESLQSDWGIWMQWQIWLSWFCVFKLDISEERVHLGSFSSNLCRLCTLCKCPRRHLMIYLTAPMESLDIT